MVAPASELDGFVEPDWHAPLDARAALRLIPESATITGMFIKPAADAVLAKGSQMPAAHETYHGFRHYPLRVHAEMLLEACRVVYGHLPLRIALRKLGRAAPKALLNSTLGKVTLGSTSGVHAALRTMGEMYPVNVRCCTTQTLDSGDHHYVLRLKQLYYFLDSHHVGAMEGAMRYAGAEGQVRLRSTGPLEIDFLCTW